MIEGERQRMTSRSANQLQTRKGGEPIEKDGLQQENAHVTTAVVPKDDSYPSFVFLCWAATFAVIACLVGTMKYFFSEVAGLEERIRAARQNRTGLREYSVF